MIYKCSAENARRDSLDSSSSISSSGSGKSSRSCRRHISVEHKHILLFVCTFETANTKYETTYSISPELLLRKVSFYKRHS